MPPLVHSYSFDPSHGYSEEALRSIQVGEGPEDFSKFWREKFQQALDIPLNLTRHEINIPGREHRVFEIHFNSFDNVRIGGWLFVPEENKNIQGAFVMGHGYGTPTLQALIPLFSKSIVLRINSRGFGLSQFPGISNDPQKHVLCGITSRETYVHLGCAADIWAAGSAILQLYPELQAKLFYWGESFGGGIGALALPWDKRFKKACLIVPSFGNHPLRVQHECTGSGKAVREVYLKNPLIMDVLKYFDSAVAARLIDCPTFVAAARFDPAVPPFGQFSVYNSLHCPKELFVLTAGHHSYPEELEERKELNKKAGKWFF